MNYEETKHGFDYGAVSIRRCCSDEKTGWVILSLKTSKKDLQIYITKTGKVRIYNYPNEGEWCNPKKTKEKKK